MTSTHAVSTGTPVETASAFGPHRAAAVAVAATGLVAVADPTSHHVPICPLYNLTGIHCPLCGGLRAVYELTHFDVAAAWHYNAVVVVGIPIAVALWFAWVLRARAGQENYRWPKVLKVTLVVLLIAFAVARNLPFGEAFRPA